MPHGLALKRHQVVYLTSGIQFSMPWYNKELRVKIADKTHFALPNIALQAQKSVLKMEI